MDRSLPLTIVLHLDYVPYDEETGFGWDIPGLEYEIRKAVSEPFNRWGDDVKLVDLEVIEPLRERQGA